MQTHKRIRTVLAQVEPVTGAYRLRKLAWVAGDRKTETVHKEYGCQFKVDLATCYFSPRLSYERTRVAGHTKPKEVVINMFAGVGCYSILLAKFVPTATIYSIDINPNAVYYMQENIRLNRVETQVIPRLGDAKEVIDNELRNTANRILMPLPAKAYEYLETAIRALKPKGGWLHYYDFEHAPKEEDPVEKSKAKISRKLDVLNVNFTIPAARVVRATGPNWYQVVLDIHIMKNSLQDDCGA